MDKRTENRLREHKKHKLEDTGRTSVNQPNRTFHICDCGWFGWLDTNETSRNFHAA